MSGAQGPGDASQHSTRQEVAKLPHTTCRRCGLSGVSAMVKEGACVNSAACERRQRKNGKRQPATAAEQVAAAKAQAASMASPPPALPEKTGSGLSPELEQMLAQMDADMAADRAKEKQAKAKKRRKP